MLRTLAIIATILGGLMTLIGIFGAIAQLASMYSSALSDPMGNAPAPVAKDVSSSMLTYVAVGTVGVVLLTIGSFILGKGVLAWLFKRRGRGSTSPKR
jgi:hypothetical protein